MREIVKQLSSVVWEAQLCSRVQLFGRSPDDWGQSFYNDGLGADEVECRSPGRRRNRAYFLRESIP